MNSLIFHKFSNLNKKIQQLRGKLKIFLKKGRCRKPHHILNILDIESRIKHLERIARSFGLKSEPIQDGNDTYYRVQSNTNPNEWYIVRPNAANPEDRCECGDCYWRGVKCLHQHHVQRKYLTKKLLPKFPFKKIVLRSGTSDDKVSSRIIPERVNNIHKEMQTMSYTKIS